MFPAIDRNPTHPLSIYPIIKNMLPNFFSKSKETLLNLQDLKNFCIAGTLSNWNIG